MNADQTAEPKKQAETAYDKFYLTGVMNVTRLLFVKCNEINDLDIYSQIDAYMRTSGYRERMDHGNWQALMCGWKMLYHDIDFSGCRPGEKTDNIILHWIADITVYTQWHYRLSSKEMSELIPAKELMTKYYVLHEAGYSRAAAILNEAYETRRQELETQREGRNCDERDL